MNTIDPRPRLRPVICVTVLTGALIMLLATEWGSLGGSKSMGELPMPLSGETKLVTAQDATPGVIGGPTLVRAFNAPRIPPPTPEGKRSPLADHLNDPERTARDDVAIVAELFANYLEIFRKLPVGTNPEITAALAGDNARALAPLPPDHHAINRAGELVDRWGAPYFFHHVSREVMEIRAAGPDQRHFTADDVVWPESEAAVVAGPL